MNRTERAAETAQEALNGFFMDIEQERVEVLVAQAEAEEAVRRAEYEADMAIEEYYVSLSAGAADLLIATRGGRENLTPEENEAVIGCYFNDSREYDSYMTELAEKYGEACSKNYTMGGKWRGHLSTEWFDSLMEMVDVRALMDAIYVMEYSKVN